MGKKFFNATIIPGLSLLICLNLSLHQQFTACNIHGKNIQYILVNNARYWTYLKFSREVYNCVHQQHGTVRSLSLYYDSIIIVTKCIDLCFKECPIMIELQFEYTFIVIQYINICHNAKVYVYTLYIYSYLNRYPYNHTIILIGISIYVKLSENLSTWSINAVSTNTKSKKENSISCKCTLA